MHLSRRDLLVAGLVAGVPGAARADFPAPGREAMLPVPGGRVYVRVNGDLRGPRAPVVVVNGGPGSTHGYNLPALALADERAVILYDQLDTGRSDAPGDPANWRVPRFADELAAVGAGLGVARWNVVGHSWGGTVALEYAARRPAGLNGVALLGPLVSTRRWIRDTDARRRTLPRDLQATLAACERRVRAPAEATCTTAAEAFYARFLQRTPGDPAVAAYVRANNGNGVGRRLYRAMWGPSEFTASGSLARYDGEALLARLDGPRTLFAVGQWDETLPTTVAGWAERVPGAEFAVVPGSGHGVFDDRPAETVALLRGWLRRMDAAANGDLSGGGAGQPG